MLHDSMSRAMRALREKTEELLTRSGQEPGITSAEMTDHVRQLHLHQTRLEIENEELRGARRKAEEGEARYADLYERAPVGYLTLDEQGLIVELNLPAAALLGEEREALLGRPLSLSLHADFQDLLHLHLRNALQSSVVQSCDLLIKGKDGGFLKAQLESLAVPVEGRAVIRSTLSDISPRRRSEQDLKEGLELLRAVVEGTSDAIHVKDAEGRYILFNAAAERATGLKASEVIGKKDSALFPANEAKRLAEADSAVLAAGRTETYEETRAAAGREKTFLSTRGPIRDGQGRMKGIFCIARDVTGLKKTQKALLESESRLGSALRDMEKLNRDLEHRVEELDAVFNTAPIGIAISYDPQCLHIKGNPALASMFGLSTDDNLSKTAPAGQRPHNFTEIRDGRELAPRELPMQVAAAKGVRIANDEMDLVHDDGRVVKLLVSAAPLLNEHGRPRGAVGAFLDISELKKTQQSLLKAHRRIATILESITDGFISFDRQWRYTYVNDTACKLLMRTREELLGARIQDAFPEAIRQRFHTDFVRAIRDNAPVHFEEFFPLSNAWYECHCYPSSEGLSVYFHDITERRRAEEARKQYVAKLDTLLDVSRDVLAAASFDDMLHRAQDGARALAGARLALASGEGAEALYLSGTDEVEDVQQGELFEVAASGVALPLGPANGIDHPAWRTVLERRGGPNAGIARADVVTVFADGKEGEGRGEFTAEDETVLSRLAAVASLGLRHVRARNEVEHVVEERTKELRRAYDSLKAEMHERKKAEQQLRQSQKMEALGTMAGGIGHDFNNVLAAVIGFAELAYDRMPAGSADKLHLERVLEAGLRGRELVNQMLTFSSQVEQLKKPLLVSGVIKDAMKLLRPSIPSTIDIRVSLRREPGPVMADPSQMRQVIVNLCNNAAHAMAAKGGTLEVELDEFGVAAEPDSPKGLTPGTYVRLAVRDTGPGIPPEHIERVFDPFFTTKKGDGAGLGLSVVHGIIEQTGGHIAVASAPGAGTAFTVYLPVTEEGAPEEPERNDAVPTGRERVLFVDDEKALCDLAGEMLERLGYQVTVETSSIGALKLFIADPSRFDLVVTDQTMPQLTGMELARQFMALKPDIPVVLVTGFSYLVDAEAAKAEGIRAVVLKPLTKAELARTLRKVLDEAERSPREND